MTISKTYLISAIFIVWSVFSILGTISSSAMIGRIVQLSIFFAIGLAVVILLTRSDILSNKILRLLIIWLFYALYNNLLFANSTQLGLIVTLIAVSWWVIVFILFYSIFVNDFKNNYYHKLIKLYPYFYFLIFALSLYKMVFRVGSINYGIIEANALNSVYWVLLLVPFAFLLKNTKLRYIILVLTFISVIISSKRGATIAISLVIIFSLIKDSFQWKHLLRNLIYGAIMLVGLFFILEKTISIIDVNVINRFEKTDFEEESRMYLYIDTWNSYISKDMTHKIFGSGYRSTAIDRGGLLSKTAHNDYLEVLYDYGILGLILYLYLTWQIVNRLKIMYRIGGKYFHAYFSAFIIFFVMSMVSHLIIYPTYFAYIVIIWALTEAQIVKTGKTQINYLS